MGKKRDRGGGGIPFYRVGIEATVMMVLSHSQGKKIHGREKETPHIAQGCSAVKVEQWLQNIIV